MIITSKDNEQIKEIKKLKEKKFRKEESSFLVEGVKLVKEAITYNANIKKIVISEDAIGYEVDEELIKLCEKYNPLIVSPNVFSVVSDVQTPQGILAVIKIDEDKDGEKNNKKEIDYSQDFFVVLDGIQDPGNLGTIIRTCDAAGITQVIVSEDTVDCYSPKVIRSTMGGIYRVNVVEADLKEVFKDFQVRGIKTVVTSLEGTESIYDLDFKKKAVVIGNEANGVDIDLQNMADKKVKIPMPGKAESLNASVAASIMIYEYVRQSL